MSKYLQQFRTYLENIEKSIANEQDEHHRAILRGYIKHACYEFGSATDQIFTPEMTIEHPVYNVKLGRAATTVDRYDGEVAVKSFYDFVNSQLVMFRNETLWVNDWGLSSRSELVRVLKGSKFAEEGVEVEDPEAYFAEITPIVMFWPYDDDAKLIGEDVYQLEDPYLERMSEQDMFTEAERNVISAEFLARQL